MAALFKPGSKRNSKPEKLLWYVSDEEVTPVARAPEFSKSGLMKTYVLVFAKGQSAALRMARRYVNGDQSYERSVSKAKADEWFQTGEVSDKSSRRIGAYLLDERHHAILEGEAQRMGTSRTAVVRMLIDQIGQ